MLGNLVGFRRGRKKLSCPSRGTGVFLGGAFSFLAASGSPPLESSRPFLFVLSLWLRPCHNGLHELLLFPLVSLSSPLAAARRGGAGNLAVRRRGSLRQVCSLTRSVLSCVVAIAFYVSLWRLFAALDAPCSSGDGPSFPRVSNAILLRRPMTHLQLLWRSQGFLPAPRPGPTQSLRPPGYVTFFSGIGPSPGGIACVLAANLRLDFFAPKKPSAVSPSSQIEIYLLALIVHCLPARKNFRWLAIRRMDRLAGFNG